MAKFERYEQGQFSWVDLMTPSMDASTRFYSQLFGWSSEPTSDDGGGLYAMSRLGGVDIAGMGEMSADMKKAGVPPTWSSYVTVEDADAMAARAEKLGAKLQMPVIDIEKEGTLVGRMTILADPEGARLSIWQPGGHAGAGITNEPGSFCWNELLTRDSAAATGFYGDLFGWKFRDIGDGYREIMHGDRANGGVLPWREEMGDVPAHWGVYFAVEDCDVAVEKVRELGGELLMGPVQIDPGRFALVADSVGASFYVMKLNAPDD